MSIEDDAIKYLGAEPLGQILPSGRQPTTKLDNTVASRQQALAELSNKTPNFFNHKIIKSGNVIDYYEYENPVFYNTPPKKKGAGSEFKEVDRSDEYKKRNIFKTRNRIIRLANTNFKIGNKFLTLTFKDTDKFDVTNIEECNERKTSFMKKLKGKYPNLKYLVRLEFQDKFDRGAIHYHIICNLPYVHHTKLTKLWGHGSIDIEKIDNYKKLGPYIAKYLTKNLDDKRLDNHRVFSYSQNLKNPTTHIGPLVPDLLKVIERMGVQPSYQAEYQSDYHGKVKFKRYNLANLKTRKGKE